MVETQIGPPKIKWDEIPINEKKNTKNLGIKIIDINNKEHIGGTAINVGNPHVIFFEENISNFDLKKILIKIKKFGFSRLLVESGTSLIKNLLSNNLIDDFYLFQSKTFLKKNGKKSFKSIFNIYLKRKKKNYIKVNLFGDKLIYFNIKNV